MKVEGLGSLLRTKPFTLVDSSGAERVITLTAPSLGFLMKFRKEVPEPLPPKKMRQNMQTGKVEYDIDREDPAFKAADAEDTNAYSAALLIEGLRQESSVRFESVRGADVRAFYLAVFAEFEAAGFSAQTLSRIIAEIQSIGAISDESIKAAKGFLGQAEPEAKGS